MIYFYLACLIGFIIFYSLSVEFMWVICITLSSVYLIILYNSDKDLHSFYRVLNIGNFRLHLAKVIIIYILSLLEIITVAVMVETRFRGIEILSHFLAFYAAILFFKFPDWLKLLSFISVYLLIDIILSFGHFILSSLIILFLVSLILIALIHDARTE